MREIKFRAWDGNVLTPPASLQQLIEWSLKKPSGASDELSTATFMQYTGLKDKNGVEIYEGDIVRLRFHEAPDGESFENGQIKWHEGSAAFKWWSGDGSDLNNYWLSQADDRYREVIGNIYENPELIKENKQK